MVCELSDSGVLLVRLQLCEYESDLHSLRKEKTRMTDPAPTSRRQPERELHKRINGTADHWADWADNGVCRRCGIAAEAYRSASPVTPEPLHDLLDEVYGAFHPFLSVTGEMSSEDQWPKEHMVEFTICWERILRAFHAWENLGDYLSASLPLQQAQPPRSREFTDAVRLANKILDRPSGDPDDDLAVLSRQFLRAIEPKYAIAAPSTPPAPSPTTKKTGCNRHKDCKIADTIWREKHPDEKFIPLNFHCHDDECEDCFGC